MKKWLICFVEWSEDGKTWNLSHISWKALFIGYFNKYLQHSEDVNFEWHWVAPWRVKID